MSRTKPERRGWGRSDTVSVVVALALIALAAGVGVILLLRGYGIVLPAPPLVAFWKPHVGWGTPLVLVCVVLGLRLQRSAARLGWGRLLLLGWLLNLAWMVSLTLVDGFRTGWADVLLDPNEYLKELPRITGVREFLASFTHLIAFGPGVTGDNVWTTHVAGHPPLATLVFWVLARIGLPGGFWAGTLCIVVSSAVCVAIPATLRELGAPGAARRLVPLLALFPGAVWMAVSADGLFAGVAAAGLALVCRGARRGGWWAGLLGGLLLGATVYLSYGLVLFGIVVVAVAALTWRRDRAWWTGWSLAGVGFVGVAAAHTALGFNWFAGLAALKVRYYQGIASARPYAYFVWANLAAWATASSPLLAVAITRSVRVVRRWRDADREARTVAVLALSGLAAALVADLSGLSKAETERIWLAFGMITFSGLALLRGRAARGALLGAALWAIAVNHLLDTGW